MQKIKNLCQLTGAEIRLTDISQFQNQPVDTLEILLDAELLQIEQFQLTPEKNVSEAEQIVWHINASLPQPIEDYYYAYQIYLRDEQNLQGLFCVIAREKLAPLTALPDQSIRIYSADRQFLLYEHKLNFWEIDTYLQRLLHWSRLFLLGAAALALLCGPALFWLQNKLSAQNAVLLREKQSLSGRLSDLKAYERTAGLLQKNKILNQKLSAYFYAFSLNLPEQLYFTELTYAAQELKINGFCALDRELKALQKALKTETVLKPELAKLSKGASINFALRVDLQKLLEKELKNVQTAKK
ncbi:MAG: hypothetical protein LBQ83_04020 [Candidatus Margulisbacteria bacterium]|jgi:Tfp pilus assembly protein PilN|nr:hypothetical protein [Candidatus Margulisiibacteriota bacterium]